MDYLKNFKMFESEDSSESGFNLESVMSKIKEEYDEMKVAEMIDEEVLSGGWVESDWEEEYESEHGWYGDFGTGEAEDVVINDIISWYESKYGALNTDDKVSLMYGIKDEFNIVG